MKVVIVCDWLTNVGGAEKVLLRIHRMYPKAPIYTSKYDPKGIDWFEGADIRTGWLNKFPTWTRRMMGPLRQRYFARLDLSEYDLIISVTGAEAKAVRSGKWLAEHGKKSANPRGIHVSYCHVPTQYYWQMYDEYMRNPGFGILNPFVRLFFKMLVVPLRKADLKAAQVPDYYVTISEYAKEQFKTYYGREATIVHPPVEIKDFLRKKEVEIKDCYITTSRQVNWKRIDLAIKACMMTQRKLLVIGDGSEHKKLVKLAAGSGLVEFLPVMNKTELAKYLVQAKGYLFPSLEPFGIAPVEALAAGCPVIAYGVGGARDYIKDGKNGILFAEQTAKSLAEAILKFEKMKFNRERVAKSALKFDEKRFDKELKDFIKRCEKKNAKSRKDL
ncbi:MAG: glycosyltransferase [Candidatus Saccharibacteria bacterium]|nr:glycosyltransferase [Candidatus Saccharibacteria bacterium]